MINLVPNIKIGFDIPNLKRIVNTASSVMGMDSIVHLMPMKIKLSEHAYTVKQGCEYIIYLSEQILSKDELSDFNIKVLTHELWHVRQIKSGELKFHDKRVEWRGRFYDNSQPDHLRGWEQEARRAERKYFKQIKELL